MVWDGLEVVRSLLLGAYLPFELYAVLGKAGLDATRPAYLAIMAVLVATCLVIVVQGLWSLRSSRPVPAGGAPFFFDRGVVTPATMQLPLRDRFTGRMEAELGFLTGPATDVDGVERPLSAIDRFAWSVWRPAYVWLSLQVLPLTVYWIWHKGTLTGASWSIPLLILGAVYLLHNAPAQTLFAYARAGSPMRRRPLWFLQDLAISMAVGEGMRNTIARVAQLRIILVEQPESSSETLPREPRILRPRFTAEPETSGAAAEVQPEADRDVLGAEPQIVPEPADGVLTPVAPPAERPARLTVPPGAGPRLTRALRTLAEMEGNVLVLSERVDAWHAERSRLAARVGALRSTLGQDELVVERITSRPGPADRDVELLRAALDRLAADNTDLKALAAIARSAETLAAVVDRYAAAQQLIGQAPQTGAELSS
ncbi:MAG TPA: hypothetical protein VKX16_01925 [Chloroflexota bacterium]|nr:hypothetical protein [Chloroflexota bacterium]